MKGVLYVRSEFRQFLVIKDGVIECRVLELSHHPVAEGVYRSVVEGIPGCDSDCLLAETVSYLPCRSVGVREGDDLLRIGRRYDVVDDTIVVITKPENKTDMTLDGSLGISVKIPE